MFPLLSNNIFELKLCFGNQIEDEYEFEKEEEKASKIKHGPGYSGWVSIREKSLTFGNSWIP